MPRRSPMSDSVRLGVTKEYEIRSGKRSVSVKTAPSAQVALLDYVKSLGCRDAEIVRLSVDSVSWRGARFTAVPRATGSAGE